VVYKGGVGFRKSPRMDDKKGSTATFGSVHKGDLVQGDVTQMLNSAGGFMPMMTATQQTVMVQLNTVHTFKVTFEHGVGYRKSPNYEDRLDGPGPANNTVIQGQVCGGPEADAYIYTPQGYVPLAKPTGEPICEYQQAAAAPPPVQAPQSQAPLSQNQGGPPGYPAASGGPQGGPPPGYGAPAGGYPPPATGYPPPASGPPGYPPVGPPGGTPGYPQGAAAPSFHDQFAAATAPYPQGNYAPPGGPGYAAPGGYGAPPPPPPPPPPSGAPPPPGGYGQPPPGGYGQSPPVNKRQTAADAFRLYDTDRSGFIDNREFAQALRSLGFPGSLDDAAAIFCVVDLDGDGQVRENEFVEHWVLNH